MPEATAAAGEDGPTCLRRRDVFGVGIARRNGPLRRWPGRHLVRRCLKYITVRPACLNLRIGEVGAYFDGRGRASAGGDVEPRQLANQ